MEEEWDRNDADLYLEVFHEERNALDMFDAHDAFSGERVNKVLFVCMKAPLHNVVEKC